MTNWIVEPQHVFCYSKQRMWTEFSFDDNNFISRFPSYSEKKIQSLTVGPYALRKCKANVRTFMDAYEARKNQIINNLSYDMISSLRSNTTASGLHLTYKCQSLHVDSIQQYMPRFQHVLRFDIPSFYSLHRKFKSYVAVSKGRREHFYSFGCTCVT